MKNKGLTSSIVISIFLTIMLLMVFFLATNSFSETMEGFGESVQEQTEENPGAYMALTFGVIAVGLALIILFIIPMAFILVTSSILLPISIKNRKSDAKWIRILSYVFDGLLASCIIFDVVKFILIRIGIG